MRWAIGIAAVVVLAVAGYQYFRPERPPPGADPAVADRTQALADEVADRAQRTAAEAARRMQETAERVADAARDVAGSGEPLKVDGTDVGKGLADALDHVTATLGAVTDQTSAAAAVPALVEIDARLRALEPKVERLPEDARTTLAALLTGMLPRVHSAIDRVEATPGAGAVVRTALGPIMARLDDWSEKPA